MRLYDKVISAGTDEHAAYVRRFCDKTTVFCVDSIAEHYGTSLQEEWGSEYFPYATPPWKYSFVEWNEPSEWRANGVTEKGRQHYQQAGLFSVYIDDPKEVAAVSPHAKKTGHWKLVEGLEGQFSAFIASYPFICRNGVPLSFELRVISLLRSDGWVLRDVVTGGGLARADNEYAVTQEIGNFSTIAHLACTFANCSNVKLVDVSEELAPPPKIRRRLKLPEVKRYTLEISGHVSRPSRELGQCQQGIMPFHLCRGHFATYTAEKPLFGRHVGRFWIPPHMKGRKDRGEVIKDYRVKG